MFSNEIKLGIYRHFKGDRYLVLGVFHCTETLEKYVAYVGLSGFWVRPLELFLKEAEVNKNPVSRFDFQKEVTAGKIGQVIIDKGRI